MSKYQTQAEKATECDRSEAEGTNTDDVEPRTRRALEEYMTVLPNHGAASERQHAYAVFGENERSPDDADEDYYIVDMNYNMCTCGDHMKRQNTCKHMRRVEILTGERPVTPQIQENVTPVDNIGDFIETDIRYLMPDGGVVSESGSESESESESEDDEADTDDVSTDGGSDTATRVSAPIWSEPKLEVDQYGQPTGEYCDRWQDCGIEVLDGHESRTAHREGCVMTTTTTEEEQ